MLCVRLEALVRICAHRARIRKAESPPGRKPVVQEIVHQAFARHHLGHLIEPGLRHVEDQQDTGQLGEHAELLDEGGHILARQRIVKRSVPGVELDLRIGGRSHDRDERDGQHQESVALARSPESRGQPLDFRREAVVRRPIGNVCAVEWLARLLGHRSARFPLRARRSDRIVGADFADPRRSRPGQFHDLVEIARFNHPQRHEARAWDALTLC